MIAPCNLVLTPDGRLVPEGTASGVLMCVAGATVPEGFVVELDAPEEPKPPRVAEPEVKRTRVRRA